MSLNSKFQFNVIIMNINVVSLTMIKHHVPYPFSHRTALRCFSLLARVDDFFKSNGVLFEAGSAFKIVPKVEEGRGSTKMSVVRARFRWTL